MMGTSSRAGQIDVVEPVVSAPPPQRPPVEPHSRPPAVEETDGHDAGKKGHSLDTGRLGSCGRPGTCGRTNRSNVASPRKHFRGPDSPGYRLNDLLFGDARDWAMKFSSFIDSHCPVMNPHAKVIQEWDKFFVISCMVAIFIDPLLFFILSIDEKHKCIVFNWSCAIAIAVVRSMTDFIYLLHMLLQFRLAYIAPESRSVGAWDVVVQPKKIALHYLRGYFILDFFVVLPLPQVMILVVIPKYLGSSAANYAKSLLRATVLLQHIPKMFTFLPLLAAHSTCFLFIEGAAQSASGFIFESAWANFIINLLMFLLAGHVVGSCWYLFGLQQISTLAGNLVPSEFVSEVLFTMVIIGLGLLLFALLIGNVQNFLLALGRRTLEMQLRRRDVEQWMHLYRFPGNLRRQIRQAERSNWAATLGVNGEELLDSLPENLQGEIRRHRFTFLNKIHICTLMDEPLLDAIRKRLKHKLYIGGSYIQCQGDPIEKMVFIVRGKMVSIGADGHTSPLSEGDVCGEELIIWFLEHSSLNKDGKKVRCPGQQLFSDRSIKCITNVEAFALHGVDMEHFTSRFTQFLRNPRVKGIIRYESPYWRTVAATHIQVMWRYRKRCLLRANNLGQGMSTATSDEERK